MTRLTFKDLSREDQIKAINNITKESGLDQLAYLIEKNEMDLYGWFSFKKSTEGQDYWLNLINKKDYEL